MKKTSHPLTAFTFSGVVSLLMLLIFSSGALGQEIKPEIINNVPKNIPLKVEIIEPATASEYPEGIRIKVTNTGDRAIYWIRMYLEIDDPEKKVYNPKGELVGFDYKLLYGRDELSSAYMEAPTEADLPISPNGTYVFTVSKYYAKILKNSFEKKGFTPARTYRLTFGELTFNDTSGFSGRTGKAFPAKKN